MIAPGPMHKPDNRKPVKKKAAKPIDRLRIDFRKDSTGVHVHASGNGVKQFDLRPLFMALQWVSEHQQTAVALLEAWEQGRLVVLAQGPDDLDVARAVSADPKTVQ